MAKVSTTNQMVREFARVLSASPLPSDAVRTAAYNDELVRRYRTGQYLTEADKRDARALIARQLA